MPPKKFFKVKASTSKAKVKQRKPTTKASKPKVVVHKYIKTVIHVHSQPPTQFTPKSQLRQSIPTPKQAPSAKSGVVTIYVLALANGKYYVGKTSRPNVEERLEEHKRGYGSAWTKLHAPIAVAEVIPDADPFDEDKITKKWMLKHGVANVRGGSYSRVELSPTEMEAISQQLRGSTDQCFVCGSSGHFAAKCTTQQTRKDESESASEDDQSTECLRCGREGHTAESCYAKTHANGTNWCLRCGREGHERASCYAKSHAVLDDFPDAKEKTNDCGRCGREGHFQADCYAKTHASGARIV